MRLLILAGLIYLAYKAAKSWMGIGSYSAKAESGPVSREIDDIMVKDPFCEVYFPKRDAVRLMFRGQEQFFCSSECRDRFLEQQTGGENSHTG